MASDYCLFHDLLAEFSPHLEFQLKSPNNAERLRCSLVLAKVFCEKYPDFATEQSDLWEAFLGRHV
jgi:hypothetical protein